MGTDFNNVVRVWSPPARKLADLTIQQYGAPHFVLEDQLAWNYGGTWWKRMSVGRSGTIEQAVYYIVPEPKLIETTELAACLSAPVHLHVDVAEQEAVVASDSEPGNLILLNIMHDVARGALRLSDAEIRYQKALERIRCDWPEPYATQLQFHTDANYIGVNHIRV